MGSQEERDWVDVANDLLSKCHISLRLTKVTDCDAGVFVALYQAILGEKVPDYIAATRSQEDDIHNVQSVIDSLALDYLQISLSHITGENVVRGDKESIKNLLEIFDGLLEYLTEHVSEEELLDEGEPNHMASKVGTSTDQQLEQLERLSQTSSVPSTIYSSKCSDGSESTAELIRLGDSARTFMASQEERINGVHHADISSSRVEVEALQDTEQSELDSAELAGLPVGVVSTGTPFPNSSLLKEPLHSAIPLQPPYQTTPRRLDRLAHSGTRSPASMPSQRGAEEEDKEHHAVPAKCQSPRSQPDSLPANVISSPRLSPDQSEVSVSSQRRASAEVGGAQPEASRLGPRRVLFRTQPAVVPITVADTAGMRDSEESKVGGKPRPSSRRHHPGRTAVSKRPTEAQEELDEPLSQRTRRNRETEQELHQMSEKLARRLEELDSMLKRALGESLETSGTREEDKQSHHSDSVMERRGLQRHSDTAPTPKSSRTRSLSPSPPPVYHFLEVPLEGALAKDLQQYGSEVRQSERQSPQMLGKVVDKAYEEELKQFEERKRADVEKARGQAQDAERAYREAILQEVPCPPEPSRVNNPKVTLQHRTARARGRALPRKAAPMKVKDNDLLPILLEELPYLQLSPHTLTRMWKQQMKQSHRLAPQPDQRSRIKQANQIEEAQRRHDLLLEIIRKEQEHNQRLHDFKERIQQQKSAQNKLREQRQQVARARKYHNEYHVQLRARLMRTRTQEERMFKHIFEEGLELQKARLREQRAYAKEQRQEHQRRHRDQLESMENYYKDQFSLLAETLAQERHEIQVRKKAQEKALQKMRRELRAKMEREIGELQKIIIQNDDDTFFRDLEVERLRERLQMTSFQYRTGHRT